MIITATQNNGNGFAKFTWNEDFTECNHVAIEVSDEDFNSLIENKVHEGCDLNGWTVKIDLQFS